MAKKYTSEYSGKRIDRSVGMIPKDNPDEESILVISSDGKGGYKKVSEVGVTVVQETGDSETQVMSQKAVTNALGTKVDEQGVEGMISETIVQTTGKATDKVMSQDATTKELSKKLNLIEPSGVQTDYVMVKKRSDGTIEQVQETGIFTPGTSYSNFTPVLRGLQGQLRGQTALPADQNNLDLINRGELDDKLRDKASKTYIHKVNILSSDGGVPPMEIQVYSKSITSFTQISDIPDGCYTMTNFGDEYFGLLAFYSGKISRIWNSRNTLNCEAYITPSETSYIFSGDTVVEL